MNPFDLLRRCAHDVLTAMGCRHQVVRAVVIEADDGSHVTIPVFSPPPMSDGEAEIYVALEKAGRPLLHKEIAEATCLSLRTVERHASALYDRKIILRHPRLGFYVPGAKIEE